MIDLACIITTGGVILFFKAFCQMKPDVLSRLVSDGLLSSKIQTSLLLNNSLRLKWQLFNELELIFVVAYQEIFQIQYVEVLLEMMRDKFVKNMLPQIIKNGGIYKSVPCFENDFSHINKAWQQYCDKKQERAKETKKFEDTTRGQEIQQKKGPSSSQTSKVKGANDGDGDNDDDGENNNTKAISPSNENDRKSRIDALKARQSKIQEKGKGGAKSPNSDSKSKSAVYSVDEKISNKKMSILDFSKTGTTVQQPSGNVNKYLEVNEEEDKKLLHDFIDSDQSIEFESDDEKVKQSKKPSVQKKGGMFARFTNKIKNITGNQKELTEVELQPVLIEFKDALMDKNVAEEIAQKICDAIKQRLLSTKTKAFTSVSRTVQDCLRETLTKVLTPKRHIDIIAETLRSREKGKPYMKVIVFIGVNGVGKSTNLAKVAYLYKSQGFSVMIAACDNFRAGAVEQVKHHGECLGVPVYDRGYKDEPPEIAYQAVREATLKKIDVVLVDTAGRMQHNETLMRALSRIVVVNNPDLIVFIGEALVGNDGVDQLVTFNKALIDNSPKDTIREIDAIIISKFDTVDEKVGAALSLTSATGKPIIFVGVGQKYTHLKKLNVNTVVQALLS